LPKESPKVRETAHFGAVFRYFKAKMLDFVQFAQKFGRPHTDVAGEIRHNNQFQQFFLPVFCAICHLVFSRN
jgi:hypothetical protein